MTLNPPLENDLCGVGIDPGQTNMGMAAVYKGHADIYQIKLPSGYDAVSNMKATATVVEYILSMLPGPKTGWPTQVRDKYMHCVIEGAAYGAVGGQVPLAENRTSAAIQTMRDYIPVTILTPGEIKMRIFGKGNMRAGAFWPYLRIKDEKDKLWRDDAAAALSCAFLAYTLKRLEAN